MAVILAQTISGNSLTGNTQATWNNNTTTGNTIIVVIGNGSTTANNVSGVSDSQNNTYQKVFSTANNLLADLDVWYATGIQGGTTPTITVSYTAGTFGAFIAREYWGLYIPSQLPLDQQISTTGSSTALNSGNVQLKQPVELLIGAGLIGLTNTFTVGSGFGNLTNEAGTSVFNIGMEDQYVTSIGPWAATFTSSGTTNWVCGIASFTQAPAGTTTSTSFTTSTSISSTSASSTSSSISSTSSSTSMSSTSTSLSITTVSTSSTSTSVSSTSTSSTSSSTSVSSTSTSVSSTSTSSTSQSSTSTSISISSTSTSFSSTSSSISSTSSSVSSTSFSSTSSSSSTSTTTLPPPYLDYTYQDEASYIVVQQFTPTSATTWVCPANVTSVLAECWGGGGGGGGCSVVAGGSTAGGGGAYANTIVSVTPGTSYTVTVGTGGAAGTNGGTNGGNGGASWFSSTGTVQAGGGGGGIGNIASATPASGGSGGTGTGTVTYAGGNGGGTNASSTSSGGGGGGGAGSLAAGGVGGVAGTSAGGSAGTKGGGAYGGLGGAGGAGSAGNNGLILGGGGGGGGDSGSTAEPGGAGGAGLVQLTYTVNYPQTTNTDMSGTFNAMNYGHASTNDGDYFIQTGSKNVIEQFKSQHPNNTDNITATWKGRSTLAPALSPVLLQIYNQTTPGWETIASQTVTPADTDFILTGSPASAVSNYYDSTNTVSCRVYQLVV